VSGNTIEGTSKGAAGAEAKFTATKKAN
jgi:hypothetical protein